MKQLISTNIGRLRLIAFLEGISLLVLIFIGMPAKYMWEQPILVKTIGPVHGGLFLLFIVMALIVALQVKWKFITTLVVMASSFIPFGTFYVDWKILRKAETDAVQYKD